MIKRMVTGGENPVQNLANDMDKKIRVLHLVDGLLPGGTGWQLCEYLRRSSREHFSHSVLNLSEGPLHQVLETHGFQVISLNVRYKFSPRLVTGFLATVRRLRPHILHATLFQPNVFGAFWGRLAGIPTIVLDERGPDLWKRNVHVIASNLVYRWADKVLAVSQAVREILLSRERLQPDFVEVLPTGVNREVFHPGDFEVRCTWRQRLGLSSDTPVLGTVARLIPSKGHDVLLGAIGEVATVRPDIKLIVIGEGTERSKLERMAYDLNLHQKVVFLGFRSQPEVTGLLAAIDIFVQASREEGHPGAVLQALACGVPVVATDVGGTRELIEDGTSGLLVPQDDPLQLSEAILRLLASTDMRQAFSQRGQKVAERFDWDKLAPIRDAFYLRLLGKSMLRD